MMPAVSILVCTYGRTAYLAECLESFARQSYDGPLQMVVINDCPMQTLSTIVPGVLIVNIEAPCASYAAKRNLALSYAKHDLVCLWDDDDIYLPTFVASVVGKLHDDDKGMRLSRLMKWDGRIAKVIVGAQYHTAVLRTEAVREIGGWRDVDITDADFQRRLVEYRFFHGAHQHEPDSFPPLMIYRNDAERVHMEGGSAPRLTREQFMEAMNRRIYAKKEPRGLVDVHASWSQDWEKLVQDHLP